MDKLRLDLEDRVATVILDDPQRRNAITPPLVDELVAAFDELEGRDDVGAVVVTGAPPAFCAGADLSHLEDAARAGLRRIYDGFLRITRSTLPTVAAVGGPAVGAGVNLALACDLRICSHTARFDSRFLELGLHPGGGHTWMLRQIGGAQLAAAMVLFGQRLDGEAAARYGLVWRAVGEEELLPTAREIAARAAAVPRELMREAKVTLSDMAALPTHPLAVERELGPQAWSLKQPFFAERLKALREKIGKA